MYAFYAIIMHSSMGSLKGFVRNKYASLSPFSHNLIQNELTNMNAC